MGAIIEVKYFNTFLLKRVGQIGAGSSGRGGANGSFGIPEDLGGYPQIVSTNVSDSTWAIEESRIRGGYNNTTVDFGVKAYLVEDEPSGSVRGNALIYSGIFNSRTGINDTNVFSVGEDITKSVDPAKGSIQKLYAEDTNLVIFQENKVSRALIDKDAIYSAEGGGTVTSSKVVIGQIVPYAGEFGISKNPESFAVYGYQKYFADKRRNSVLRLSMNGIEEISKYGMRDYFRDKFNDIDDTSGPGVILGGYDIHNKQYVVSTQKNVVSGNEMYDTLSFDEGPKGWVSFFTYKPDHMFSLRNDFYTMKDGELFRHYDAASTNTRGTFYGERTGASITFVFNPKVSTVKSFKTIGYEGSNGWEIDTVVDNNNVSYPGFISSETGQDSFNNTYTTSNDSTTAVKSYYGGEYVINPADGQVVEKANYNSVLGTYDPALIKYHAGFDRKENKYVARLKNNTTVRIGEILHGRQISGIRGFFATVTIKTDDVTDVGGFKELFAVSSNYVESSY